MADPDPGTDTATTTLAPTKEAPTLVPNEGFANEDQRLNTAFDLLAGGELPETIRREFRGAPVGDSETAAEATKEERSETPEKPVVPEATDKAAPEKAEPGAPEEITFDDAKQILRRGKFTDEEITGFGESTSILMAGRLKASQALTSAAYSELGKLKPGGKVDKPKETDSTTDDDAGAGEGQDEDIARLEELDPELAEIFRDRLEKKATEEPDTQDRTRANEEMLRAALDPLTKTYPELGTDEGRARLLEEMEQLTLIPDRYTDIRVLAGDAAVILHGKGADQAAQARLLSANHAERVAQIDSDTDETPATNTPMTKSEKADRAFDLLQQNYSPEEVRAHLAKIPDA